MKKLISIALVMFLATNCFAGKVKVNSGNAKVFKENVSAIVEFDFSKTTWEEKEDFKTWCGNQYEKRVNAIQQSFVNTINSESKGLKISEANAKYKIIVVVKDLERHQAFTGTWGQGKFSTTCTISIIDIESNQSVCDIIADGYGSGKDYDYADGLAKCYKGLAKELIKLK